MHDQYPVCVILRQLVHPLFLIVRLISAGKCAVLKDKKALHRIVHQIHKSAILTSRRQEFEHILLDQFFQTGKLCDFFLFS